MLTVAPKVSILIPVYNRERYIETCVRSALAQTIVEIEVVICDNASTDKSFEICKRLAAEDDRIRLFRNSGNLGPVANWRRCIDEARAPIGKLLFSDDTIAPEFLEQSMPWLDDPTVAFVYTAVRIGKDQDEISGGIVHYRTFQDSGIISASHFVAESLSGEDRVPVSPGAALFRTADMKRHLVTELPGSGITDYSRHGAGPDLMMYLLTAAYYRNVAYVNDALAFFRAHADSITISDRVGKVRHCHQAARAWFQERIWNRGRGALPDTPEILLSAIVSTYNSASFLRGCLDDLLAQTIADRTEIIVIDSGSNEDESSIVEEYQAQFPNIRYLRTHRETIYGAWNRGITLAKGKYLTNANTDDRHRRDAFERLVAVLEKHPEIAVTYADQIVTDTPNETFDASHPVMRFRWPPYDAKQLFSVCFIGPQPMWRRDLHARYGYFDAEFTIAGDYDFWLRISAHEQFLHLDTVLGLYLRNLGGAEYRDPARSSRETQNARSRNWPVSWGTMPMPGGHYLYPYRHGEEWEDSWLTNTAGHSGASGCTIPFFSVVIPTKNRPIRLTGALDSLVSQQFKDFELIIVNDGGGNIESVIAPYAAQFELIYVRLPHSRGAGGARSVAQRIARGEWLCYLDDDDIYRPDHLSTLHEVSRRSEAGFLYTQAEYIVYTGNNSQERELRRDRPYAGMSYSRDELMVRNFIPTPTWCHRRELLERVGGFDEGLHIFEDWEFLIRMSQHVSFEAIDRVTVTVRQYPERRDHLLTQSGHDVLDHVRRIYAAHPSEDPVIQARRQEQINGYAPITDKTSTPELTSEKLYEIWINARLYLSRDAEWISDRMEALAAKPAFHLGVIALHETEGGLGETIKSLARQFYPHWRLSIVAESPMPEVVGEVESIDWIQLGEGESPLAVMNATLGSSPAAWVGMIEAGDQLAPQALFAFADKLERHADWRVAYSDEDSLDDHGRALPFFKTDFNLEMLRAVPFAVGGLLLLRRELFVELGGYQVELEGAESYDLSLRAWERAGDAGVGHVADILYHRHVAGGHTRRDGEIIQVARRVALDEHLLRLGVPAELEDGRLPGSTRVRYKLAGEPLVSIIIPTRNQVHFLQRCLESLIDKTAYNQYELLLVDNGSDQAEAVNYLNLLRRAPQDRMRVLSYPGEFNFAAMNNLAAREARGDYLLLLNNDTAVLEGDWLEEMLRQAQRPEVGIVGARLLFPNGRIQHAGVILGINDSPADFAFSDHEDGDPGYFGRLMLPQELSAVTAACMMIRKSVYDQVGGLDAEHFRVSFNDIDLCLKVRAAGYKVIWTPFATLLHEGSASQTTGVEKRGDDARRQRFQTERDAMFEKWRRWIAFDPAYNRNLSFSGRDFLVEIAPALSWDPEWRPRPRVLAHPADRMGCGEYRIIAPMRALNGGGRVMGWETGGYLSIPELLRLEPDSVVFQRQVEWSQVDLMQRYIRHSKAFRVFELDDLLTNVPIKNVRKQHFVEQKDLHKRFRKSVSQCHRFVVSTEFLAEEYRGYADEVVSVPNYIERLRWGDLLPSRRQGAKPRVGWAGSVTHDGDLAIIVDVVKATAQEVDWVFFGMCPQAMRPHVREFHDPVSLDDYPAKLASLNLDLAVAPLEDVPFNHGKSHLRLLEYGVLGYPVICTDITPYRGAYPVTRVPNKFKNWVEAIREHVADLDELARRGDALREHIQTHWILEDNLDVWMKAWLPG